ncbi:MAG: hypothetical protein RL029_448 [Actinomycetota bacterium]|jgi:ribosome-binding protein aMBF1 (putative translation factor)
MNGGKGMPNYRVQDTTGLDFHEHMVVSRQHYNEADWRRVRTIRTLFDVAFAIELRRKERQISKSDLGEMVDLPKSHISALEMVEWFPDFESVVKILQILDLDLVLRDRTTNKLVDDDFFSSKNI